jgi:hypothetical protein
MRHNDEFPFCCGTMLRHLYAWVPAAAGMTTRDQMPLIEPKDEAAPNNDKASNVGKARHTSRHTGGCRDPVFVRCY